MADQTNYQQGFNQNGGQNVYGEFGVTHDDVSQFQQMHPDGIPDVQIQGAEAGFGGFGDMPADQTFAQPPQPPPQTNGPYFAPNVGWHYLSTRGDGMQPPSVDDMNFHGPFYAPGTGWYYQIRNPALTVAPAVQLPGVQEGYTPSSATPYSSAVPSGMTTPVGGPGYIPAPPVAPMLGAPTVPSRSRTTRKPKYGPAVFEATNKGVSASGPPRAASISEAQYTSAAKRRDHGSGDSAAPSFGRKKKNPSIVQVCVCSNKVVNKIPRPRNAFILYLLAQKENVMKQHKTNDNQVVSKKAALMWKSETAAVKAKFHDMAAKEAARHKAEHPDYKYEPGAAARARFGSQSCTCGAYQVNMEHLMEKRSNVAVNMGQLGAQDVFQDEYDAGDDSGAYAPPRSQRLAAPRNSIFPAAKAMANTVPDNFGYANTIPQSGLALPPRYPVQAPPAGYAPMGQLQRAAPIAPMTRKRSAQQMAEQDADEDSNIAKRLRSATQNQPAPQEQQPPQQGSPTTFQSLSSGDYDFGFSTGANVRVNEKYTDSNFGGLQLPTDFANSGTEVDSPPARNTRAQSKARISPPATATGDAEGLLVQEEPMDLGLDSLVPDDMPCYMQNEFNMDDFLDMSAYSEGSGNADNAANAGESRGSMASLFGGEDDEETGDDIDVAPRRPSQEEPTHSYGLRPRGGSRSPSQNQF